VWTIESRRNGALNCCDQVDLSHHIISDIEISLFRGMTQLLLPRRPQLQPLPRRVGKDAGPPHIAIDKSPTRRRARLI
jgi:hypothetical protein